MDRYSTLGAEILVAQGIASATRSPAFYWNIFLQPSLEFIKNFIFRLGFLDGREGLMLHMYHTTYVSWKYAKAWRSERLNPYPAAQEIPQPHHD